jgi:hypothetical protein
MNLKLLAGVALVAVVNIVVVSIIGPAHNVPGWFATLWMVAGVVVLLAPISGVPLRWYVVVAVLLTCMILYCLNEGVQYDERGTAGSMTEPIAEVGPATIAATCCLFCVAGGMSLSSR